VKMNYFHRWDIHPAFSSACQAIFIDALANYNLQIKSTNLSYISRLTNKEPTNEYMTNERKSIVLLTETSCENE
jgi:hypothetical protein